MNEEIKKSNQWSILGVIGIFLSGIVLLFTQTMTNLNDATGDLTEIQSLSSGTQRCIRMVLMDNKDAQLIYSISNQTSQYLDMSSQNRLSVLNDSEYILLANDVLKNWDDIYTLINEELAEGEELDSSLLQIMIDSHFDSMTALSSAINAEVDELNTKALNLQYMALGLVLLLTAVMSNNFLQTSAALKQNKELAKLAAIDTATGLFNRSKCQDLFKSTVKSTEKEVDAVIVIDLNDLKKTNDTQGHRVGDELIYNFASLLKESCNIHQIKPFVGRYGGDEFVVYYRNVASEGDVTTYLKELHFLAEEFNKNERRFAVSYAEGYAVNNDAHRELSIRELFDLADENMYKNKQEMKRVKKEYEDSQKNG